MDFLDSIDFDSSHKKCDRVRSWYLYEQYKTLEKNQLDAAYRLKNKTYQERILKQELSERRARRRLCDQFGDCQCESELGRKIHSAHSKAPVSVSDDLFESFHELHEEYELDPEYVYTHDSKSSKNCDDVKSSDILYDASFEESLNSVVENVTIDDYLNDDIKGELEFVKKNIADNINLQLETVKENIECLEKYTKIDVDKITDEDSFSEHYKAKDNIIFQKRLNANKQNCVLLNMWSKLVAFAYNIIKLNHDNCYYDCSSQFLIGILACDVLRRGICNMCYILQPYVSPIKYASSDSDISLDSWNTVERNKINYNVKTLKPTNSIKFNKCKKNKRPKKMRSLGRKYHSESKWLNHSKHSSGNNCMCKFEYRGFSEPWCSTNRFCEDMNYYKSNKWLETFAKCNLSEVNRRKCRCIKRVVNPIKQLARYIDNVLHDITE